MGNRRQSSESVSDFLMSIGLNPLYLVAAFSLLLSAYYVREMRQKKEMAWTERVWVYTVWAVTGLLLLMSAAFILKSP